MAENNKVRYGLRNAHFAPYKMVDGTPVYEAPIPIPGSVELSLEPRGDLLEFPADDMMYYVSQNNEGYDGTLTVALIPTSFAEKCLGEIKDTDFVHEFADAESQEFALQFEFQGDKKAIRHTMFNCSASRPTINGTTGKTEVNTTELVFVASPLDVNGKRHVKTKTHEETTAAVYDAWYTEVQGLGLEAEPAGA